MASLPTTDKKAFVKDMFDNIAPRYDVLNRILSGGIDQQWRKKAIAMLKDDAPSRILDVATGTADLAILAGTLDPDEVVGVDIAEEMLQVGRTKIENRGLSNLIKLKHGDAEQLPFSEASFDAAVVAFGVRNFEDLALGLSEISRVLRPGGQLVVLEFSRPTRFPVKQLYAFYGRFILPTIGKMISGDDAAYKYLPESIEAFPDGADFLDVMRSSGFRGVSQKRLTFGIASLYSGRSSG
ncbi:MAG: bifunctional demethylmenaquinone methyltransferase/2-methoxy-6-polyprenyl-1,4-benzoquinol methylase UbiE [Bacteroidetes bacterium]|nr:MAG: bifunctional demethylmenaquinone methyltransferase/2-methoxy-6-polyprenyl-1,4-benzoquinol methylase UbiE [Bacteroidota bacterium]